jgi:enoyl-CoA hydratase/3-hydroxyacyl-CoA dehydrogenase
MSTMKLEDIKTIAVLGAGTMGHGIAEVAALAGYRVKMRDINEELVKKGYDQISWSLKKLAEKGTISPQKAEAALKLITPLVDLKEAVSDADLVIEAVPEIMSLKLAIFKEIDTLSPQHAILASNTSSLSISELGRATKRPEKVVGMHFFSPVVRMALVEVIRGEKTSEETMQLITELAKKLGKTPIRVEKDVRGFIVNRILVGPYLFEAAWLVSRGEATIEEIDSRMRYYENFPMGPFELQDLTGIDVGYNLMKEAGFPIPPIIEQAVKEGRLGRKTGRGFYNYKDGGANYSREAGQKFDPLPLYALMVNEAAWLIENHVSTAQQIDLACQLGLNFPEGLLRRADRIGLDKLVSALDRLYAKHKDPRYTVNDLLRQMVQAGKTGEAAGEGFYQYKREQREYKTLKVEIDKNTHVAYVKLNRPQRLNAINAEMRQELPRVFAELRDDPEVRVIVLAGEGGRAFSAGADITEFTQGKPYQFVELGEFFRAPELCPKPVIAAIDGFALGGGLELALACDFRLASKRSEVGQPEIHLGLIPGGGGTQRLLRLVGPARAKELCMLGERISAEQAAQWGLIDHVYENETFEQEVKAFAEKLASRAPIAVRFTKQIINAGADCSLDAALLLEREAFGVLFTTDDMREGVNAFLTKKKPEFKGQ